MPGEVRVTMIVRVAPKRAEDVAQKLQGDSRIDQEVDDQGERTGTRCAYVTLGGTSVWLRGRLGAYDELADWVGDIARIDGVRDVESLPELLVRSSTEEA